METTTQIAHMGIGANFGILLTETMRSIAWYRGDMDTAMFRMREEFPDMSDDMREQILNGSMKFQTADDGIHVNVITDDWKAPNWMEITERLVNMTTGSKKDIEKYFRKEWGFFPQQIDSIVELAEEAYDWLYEDKRMCHDVYLKVMNEIIKVEKATNRYQSGYNNLTQNLMFHDDEPEPCNNIKGEFNGWLNPKGQFYRCGKYAHDMLANDLDENGTKGLENKGWYRLSGGEWDNYASKGMNKPTNKQMDFIEKWQKINEQTEYKINGHSLTYESFIGYVFDENW